LLQLRVRCELQLDPQRLSCLLPRSAPTNAIMPAHWSSSQEVVLRDLSVSTSAISLIASLCVLGAIAASRLGYMLHGVVINKLSFRLIAALVFSDTIRSIGNLIGSPASDSAACKAQTFLKIYGSLSSFFWMIVILSTIYSLLSSLSVHVQQYQNLFHVIWVLSFVGAIIPIASNYQTNTGGWCYIKGTDDGFVMQLFCDYLWCLATWTFSVILYFKIFRSHQSLEESSIIGQVRYYPLVFFVCWSCGVVRRTLSAVGVPPPFFVVCLQIVGSNLYGLCNAIVWGLTIYNHIRKMKQKRQCPVAVNHAIPKQRVSKELPQNKLIDEQDMQFDAKNGQLVEIDLSGDDSGRVEVHEESE